MGTKVGLDHASVVEAAAELTDAQGDDALTLAGLAAHLGVRSQSLYAHVDGLDGLRRDLAVFGQKRLAHELGRAVMGRSGEDALRALCRAYTDFANNHPGLYKCCQRAPGDDPELLASSAAASEPWFAMLRSFGLANTQVVHYHRALWAALHGFVTLRRQGLMTRTASPDRSLALLVELFAAALSGAR